MSVGLLVGCGGGSAPVAPPAVVEGSSVAEPGPPCRPRPLLPSSGSLPSSFPVAVALPPGAALTAVEDAGGFVVASGRAPGDVAQTLDHFRSSLPEAGLFVGRDEDEGRGGELTFLGGSSEGAVTVATLRCPAGSTQFTVSARRTR